MKSSSELFCVAISYSSLDILIAEIQKNNILESKLRSQRCHTVAQQCHSYTTPSRSPTNASVLLLCSNRQNSSRCLSKQNFSYRYDTMTQILKLQKSSLISESDFIYHKKAVRIFSCTSYLCFVTDVLEISRL